MSNINRPVIWNAQRGIVIAEAAGRRGKVLLTVKMETGRDAGREIKVDAATVEFADEERFAPPTGYIVIDRSLYNDIREAQTLTGRRQ